MSLVISGVIDGPLSGGVPKAIELFVNEDIADLSIYGVGSANNGGGSDGEEVTLSGSASAGDYIYIASEDIGFTDFFGFAPDFVSSAASINGDDAIELLKMALSLMFSVILMWMAPDNLGSIRMVGPIDWLALAPALFLM